MHESSASQFFKTITGILSRTDFFDKSRFNYDLFNQLGSYRNIIQFQISSRRENR